MEKLVRYMYAILQVGVVAALELLSIEIQDLLTPGGSQRRVGDRLTSSNCCLHGGRLLSAILVSGTGSSDRVVCGGHAL
jgi:hypothetical protein